MKISTVRKLVKLALGVEVYSDTVPEGSTLPAAAISHVSWMPTRIKTGNISGEKEVFRISYVAEKVVEIESGIDKLMSLDNTINDDFQGIHVIFKLVEPKDADSPIRRAFVDLRLTAW